MGERQKRPVRPEVLIPGLNVAIDLLKREAKNCRDAAGHCKDSEAHYHRATGVTLEYAVDLLEEQKERLTKPQPPEVDPRQIPLFNGQ